MGLLINPDVELTTTHSTAVHIDVFPPMKTMNFHHTPPMPRCPREQEAALKKESMLTHAEATTAVSDEALIESKYLDMESCPAKTEDFIAQEVKSAETEMITKEWCKVGKTSVNNNLETSFHNVQIDLGSVTYGVIDQVLLDLLHKNVIGEMLQDVETSLSSSNNIC